MDKLKTKFLAKINKRTGRGMSETTANQYIRYLRNIHGGDFKTLTWLKDTDKILDKINEKYSPSTRASAINACFVACEVSSGYSKQAKFYQSRFQEYIKPINKQRNSGEKTEKQEEYWLSWDDIIKRRDELEGVDKVLLSLYTMLPPRRAKDYGEMKVWGGVGPVPTGNVFLTDTHEFVFRNYKTKGVYGEQRIAVPDDLYKVLIDYFTDKGQEQGDLLPFNTANLTKKLQKIFKPKKISVNALRHIYDTHHFGEAQEAMTNAANMMAHSTNQQKQYIKKV
jgi:hypothetical protein